MYFGEYIRQMLCLLRIYVECRVSDNASNNKWNDKTIRPFKRTMAAHGSTREDCALHAIIISPRLFKPSPLWNIHRAPKPEVALTGVMARGYS
jgi:hypothetical protein